MMLHIGGSFFDVLCSLTIHFGVKYMVRIVLVKKKWYWTLVASRKAPHGCVCES